jgi:hypothetical protein
MVPHVNVRLCLLFRFVVFVRQLARFLATEDSGEGFGLVEAFLAFEADRVDGDAAMGVNFNFELFSGHAVSFQGN